MLLVWLIFSEFSVINPVSSLQAKDSPLTSTNFVRITKELKNKDQYSQVLFSCSVRMVGFLHFNFTVMKWQKLCICIAKAFAEYSWTRGGCYTGINVTIMFYVVPWYGFFYTVETVTYSWVWVALDWQTNIFSIFSISSGQWKISWYEFELISPTPKLN